MRHEKIFKREDGRRVLIEVKPVITKSEAFEYKITVAVKEKGKRNWHYVIQHFEKEYRSLNAYAKLTYEMNEYLKYVTRYELLEAKLELWEKLKPE